MSYTCTIYLGEIEFSVEYCPKDHFILDSEIVGAFDLSDLELEILKLSENKKSLRDYLTEIAEIEYSEDEDARWLSENGNSIEYSYQSWKEERT